MNEKFLDHEKLDVYHVAVEFVIIADSIVRSLPRGRGYLSDQLQLAALSISLNIAEGAKEYSKEEKARELLIRLVSMLIKMAQRS